MFKRLIIILMNMSCMYGIVHNGAVHFSKGFLDLCK
jgi:hypothetical protein